MYSYAYCGSELKFTSLSTGEEETIELDNYAGVGEYDGVTHVSFYTGSEDCSTDCFAVKESLEEVEAIVKEALSELCKFRNTVTTVDKGYLAALEKIVGREAVEKLGY